MNDNRLIIVGKKAPEDVVKELEGKVGDDEYISIIDDAFFEHVEAFKSGGNF